MRIDTCLNQGRAINAVMQPEKEMICIRHALKAGESIPWHYHPETDEMIIVGKGIFWLALEKQRELFWFEAGDGYKVIFLPRRKKHALVPITPVDYLVYKIRKDEIVYCEGPNLKNELKRILSGLMKKYGRDD